MRTLQARCLHEHLAVWAPILAITIQRIARRPLHRLLAELTLELVMAEVERCRTMDDEALPSVIVPVSQRSNVQRDEEGINHIVRRLITPAEVGVFITRADIRLIAGDLQLPVSVGDRVGMLRDLFASAGQFDMLMQMLESLARTFDEAEHSLTQLAANYPSWSAHAQHWQRLVINGRSLVAELDTEVRNKKSEVR